MKKTFLVKKDPAKAGGQDNWIIMNFEEFERFLQTEDGQRRKDCFERLDPADERDEILFLEVGKETAVEMKREKNHSDYLRRQEEDSGFLVLSLDMPAGMGEEGDETTLLDLIADENADTENTAIEQIFREELPSAIAELNQPEQQLILAFYLNEEKMTVNRYANEIGESRRQIRKRHASAIRKLRLHYRRKKLL